MDKDKIVRYGFFDSLVGKCAIVWDGGGLLRVCLPLESPSETRVSILNDFPDAKESPLTRLSKKIALAISCAISGGKVNFSFVPVNSCNWSEFDTKVYKAAKSIRQGTTITYGSLAKEIGRPSAYRAVGTALGKNPVPIVVPCHRVIAGDGSLRGFSAARGVATKRILLKLEGCNWLSDSLQYDLLESSQFLKTADPRMARLIRMVGPPGIDPPRKVQLFESLLKAIVSQQLSVTAAATIHSRVVEQFHCGFSRLDPTRILISDEVYLTACGLSKNKARSVKELASRVLDKSLPSEKELQEMADEDIVESLTSVRGIGRWTAQMILIFQLGRPDVLAVDDLALRKGLAILVGKKLQSSRTDLEKYARRWRPFRSAGSWYLWRLNRSPLKEDYLKTMGI